MISSTHSFYWNIYTFLDIHQKVYYLLDIWWWLLKNKKNMVFVLSFMCLVTDCSLERVNNLQNPQTFLFSLIFAMLVFKFCFLFASLVIVWWHLKGILICFCLVASEDVHVFKNHQFIHLFSFYFNRVIGKLFPLLLNKKSCFSVFLKYYFEFWIDSNQTQ